MNYRAPDVDNDQVNTNGVAHVGLALLICIFLCAADLVIVKVFHPKTKAQLTECENLNYKTGDFVIDPLIDKPHQILRMGRRSSKWRRFHFKYFI